MACRCGSRSYLSDLVIEIEHLAQHMRHQQREMENTTSRRRTISTSGEESLYWRSMQLREDAKSLQKILSDFRDRMKHIDD